MVRVHIEPPDGSELPAARLRMAVREACRNEGIGGAEVSLIFLRDPPIRELNRSWLDHDWVPDVLTFPLHGEGEAPFGDIYVGIDQALRQAREAGVSFEEELVRLAVHGVLHLLGYDHPEEPDERESSPHFRIQEELVRRVMEAPVEDEEKAS